MKWPVRLGLLFICTVHLCLSSHLKLFLIHSVIRQSETADVFLDTYLSTNLNKSFTTRASLRPHSTLNNLPYVQQDTYSVYIYQCVCVHLQGQRQQTCVYIHVSFSTHVSSLGPVDTGLPPSQTGLLSYLTLQLANAYHLNKNLHIPSSTDRSIIKLHLLGWIQIFNPSSCIYIKSAHSPLLLGSPSVGLHLPSVSNISIQTP